MRWISIKTESVELILGLFTRGLWKDLTKINATMPHTWIVWVYAQRVHSHIAIQEMSVVFILVSLKTVRFSV